MSAYSKPSEWQLDDSIPLDDQMVSNNSDTCENVDCNECCFNEPIILQPTASQRQPIYNPNSTNSIANNCMAISAGCPDCPPNLEYLTDIDQLFVEQVATTGFGIKKNYVIKNTLGQKVYWAIEEQECCVEGCGGTHRPFNMKIMDIYQREIINFNRAYTCSECCCPCCLQTMIISSPPGNVIGRIEQEWAICYPSFIIVNPSGEKIVRIKSPKFFVPCIDITYEIVTMDGTYVGEITKPRSAGLCWTKTHNFSMTFPSDIDVRIKAALLGTCILIDILVFER